MKSRILLSVFLIAALMLFAGCDLFGKKEVQGDIRVEPAPGSNPIEAPQTPEPSVQVSVNVTAPSAGVNADVNAVVPPAIPGKVMVSPPSAQTAPIIYNYGAVAEYEYKITAVSAGETTTTNIKTKLSSDSYQGTPAWLTAAETSMEQGSTIMKMWIDKATNKCLALKTEIAAMGQTITQESACPTADTTGQPTATGEAKMTVVGTESVTVPAGTFTATKYSTEDGANIWIAANVPVPVRTSATVEGSTTTMELVSFN